VTYFSEGKASVTDKERSGQPATKRTEEIFAKVHQLVCEKCWLTVTSVAEQVNINRETIRKILTEDLDMRKLYAKIVPEELTKEHKNKGVFSY
jgi:predicted transcriptional regulator